MSNKQNQNNLAGRGQREYKVTSVSGRGTAIQGDVTVSNEGSTTYVHQYFFGEVLSEDLDTIRQHPRIWLPQLNTDQPCVKQIGGRESSARRGRSESRRCFHHNSESKHAISATGSPSERSSRSPSSTRIPRPSFRSGSRRNSSLSRASTLSDRYASPVTPHTSCSSAVTPLREEPEIIELQKKNTCPDRKQLTALDLNKPLPWDGHMLNPTQIHAEPSYMAPATEDTDHPSPASSHREAYVGVSLLEQYRHLKLAVDDFEERLKGECWIQQELRRITKRRTDLDESGNLGDDSMNIHAQQRERTRLE